MKVMVFQQNFNNVTGNLSGNLKNIIYSPEG